MAKLDKPTYLDSIREAYPHLAIRSARLHYFTDGQFNSILFVEEEGETQTIMFRFPRVESALKDLPGEIHLISGLQGVYHFAGSQSHILESEYEYTGQGIHGRSDVAGQATIERDATCNYRRIQSRSFGVAVGFVFE